MKGLGSMKSSLKVFVVGASLLFPLASFANDAQKAPASAKSTSTEHLSLEGATSENTAELVKVAKEAGATKATYNANTNVLTVSGSKFNKDKFTSSLSSSLPAVSVKN